MSSLTGCGELCYETPLRAPLTTSSRITDSDNYFDDSDSGPKPVWSGKWSSYLTDNLFGIEKIKEVNTEQTHTRITQISDVTLPGEKIDLMRFPGQKKLLMAATPIDIDRPYSAQWLPFQPKIEDIARSGIHGITLQNNFSTPMRFSLFLAEPTSFLSQVRDHFTTERDNSLELDEVETLFIDEIIKHQTNESNNPINTEYTDQPSPHENRLLALSKILGIKDPNNTKEVVLTIFDCLNRFSQGKFTKRPALHSDLPKKYIHLAHAFLSRRGVCRHQSEILHTFLKLYGIKSTIHHNHNHSFAVFSDNTIVDLSYFTSPFKQHNYEQLCTADSIIREASHHEYNLPDNVETLLQEAKRIILDPHHPDATLERIDACTKALELASPKNQSSNTNTRIEKEPLPSRLDSPVSVINEFKDNGQIHAEKTDITPNNILTLLAEGAVAASDILTSINKRKSESYLPWIQAAFDEMVMKRRKPDISEGQYIEIPNLINERKQLLTAIVSSMLEELPQGKRVVRYCLPHTDNINLQARAKKVGGAYMVSMVIPAGGNDKTITVSPPADFAEPFVLLTAHQPVLISSPEMLTDAYGNTEPLSLTEDEQHIFMEVVDEIVGTAKPSHHTNNTIDL